MAKLADQIKHAVLRVECSDDLCSSINHICILLVNIQIVSSRNYSVLNEMKFVLLLLKGHV